MAPVRFQNSKFRGVGSEICFLPPPWCFCFIFLPLGHQTAQTDQFRQSCFLCMLQLRCFPCPLWVRGPEEVNRLGGGQH
jgi:hypothetical protein